MSVLTGFRGEVEGLADAAGTGKVAVGKVAFEEPGHEGFDAYDFTPLFGTGKVVLFYH